jgi:hypothetical protein
MYADERLAFLVKLQNAYRARLAARTACDALLRVELEKLVIANR